MQTELIKELNKVLKAFPQFWNGEELQRSMVSDAISQKQPDLIKALVDNEKSALFMVWILMALLSLILTNYVVF